MRADVRERGLSRSRGGKWRELLASPSGVLGEAPDTMAQGRALHSKNLPFVMGGVEIKPEGPTIVCGKAVATRLLTG